MTERFFTVSATEPGNPAATVENIVNSETLCRSGLAAFIIVLIADVLVAWALYVFFQRTSRELSLFAAWFRLFYVVIAAAALLNLLVVLKLVDDRPQLVILDASSLVVAVAGAELVSSSPA